MFIDLRSDTLTKPSRKMIRAMSKAKTGDACYGEDTATTKLERHCASLLGKQDAIFMPSGTMSNQVAIRSMAEPGDEIILDESYHINFFESAQTVAFSQIVLNCCKSEEGILDVETIKKAMDSKARWNNMYAIPKIVSLENPVSSRGGKIFPLTKIKKIYKFAKENGMLVYIDGARIFNASTASDIHVKEYAKYCDMISFCFAKGLGAPFGSMLCGSNKLITRAKKFRKWHGGALHQSGFMAEAAMYALQNNIKRIKKDHDNAKTFAKIVSENTKFKVIEPETNMVLIKTEQSEIKAQKIVDKAKENGVLLLAWSDYVTRAVISLNNSEKDVIAAAKIIRDII